MPKYEKAIIFSKKGNLHDYLYTDKICYGRFQEMYTCDKCRFYNKCYPKTMNAYDECLGKAEVEIGGCPMYKELTIDEMFADERR